MWREEGNASWEPHGVSQCWFVTWAEAIAGKSPVFVAFCHNEYLIRPRHAWQFADSFSLLQSLHWDGGCTKEFTTSGHSFHPGHSCRQPPLTSPLKTWLTDDKYKHQVSQKESFLKPEHCQDSEIHFYFGWNKAPILAVNVWLEVWSWVNCLLLKKTLKRLHQTKKLINPFVSTVENVTTLCRAKVNVVLHS